MCERGAEGPATKLFVLGGAVQGERAYQIDGLRLGQLVRLCVKILLQMLDEGEDLEDAK